MILKNLEEITTNINNSTVAVNRRIQNFSNTVDRSQLIIDDIIGNIQCFAPLALKLPILQTIKKVVAVVKGIRVFIDVFLNKEKV
jgi:hypothetical protein